MPTTMQSKFDKILAAIVGTKAALQQDVGAVSVGLELLHAEHRKLAQRVQETEHELEDMRPAQEAVMQKVAALTDRINIREYCTEDVEGRNRQNNVCIVGLPKGTERK
ncbi:hypothetical protein NDU88_002771 [Pleurodeles waltl]|uniref:Uncharacterized protein n=1 Tax=Pleurodeles waltl TaxID=8319 RepID=A0AAV7VBI0_PLEWA|nr:hypothetical protein NDU88_002771 [Pleurodeles waltl]